MYKSRLETPFDYPQDIRKQLTIKVSQINS